MDDMNEYEILALLHMYLQHSPKPFHQRRRIICKNGRSFSVQVGEYLYCTPRNNNGPWYEVEVGYQKRGRDSDLMTSDETIISYYEIEKLARVIEASGGFDPLWIELWKTAIKKEKNV